VILGGRDRLVTGELVPRRTRVEAQNLDTLARLVQAAALTAPPDPAWLCEPVTIALEPLTSDLAEEPVAV
jgi:3-polyprenyl-4-hydroxybenzoate decarboxylase